MSLIWRTAWLTAGESEENEAVDLAREGIRLHTALNGPPIPELPRGADNSQVDTWSDAYIAATPDDGSVGMPLNVLWAGVFGADPRSDVIIQALTRANPSTTWAQINQQIRTWLDSPMIPARRVQVTRLQQLADWWSARALGLVRGSEPQQYQERAHRAYWAALVNRLGPIILSEANSSGAEDPPPAGGGGGSSGGGDSGGGDSGGGSSGGGSSGGGSSGGGSSGGGSSGGGSSGGWGAAAAAAVGLLIALASRKRRR